MLSRFAVGFVQEESHLEHRSLLSLSAGFLKLCHTAEELIGGQIIHQAQVPPLYNSLEIEAGGVPESACPSEFSGNGSLRNGKFCP